MILQSIGRTARAYWASITLACFLFPVVAACMFAFLPTPLYESFAWVMIDTGRASQAVDTNAEKNGYEQFSADNLVKSQLNIALSEQVVRSAIASFGRQRLFPDLPKEGNEQQINTAAYLMTRDAIKAIVEPNTYIIRIAFRHPNAEVAAGFTNELVTRFLERRSQLYSNPASVSFFSEQEARYTVALKKAYDDLAVFNQQTKAYSIVDQRDLALKRRDFTTAALTTTRGQIKKVENEIATWKVQMSTLRSKITLPPEIYGTTGSVPAPKNEPGAGDPPLLHVKLYQDLVEKLVASNAELAGLKGLEAEQYNDLLQVEDQLQKISAVEAEYNRLNRAVTQGEKYLETLSKRFADAQVNDAWRMSEGSSSAQVLQEATPALGPAFPKPGLMITLGTLVGLALAGVSFYFLHYAPAMAEARAPQPRRRPAPREAGPDLYAVEDVPVRDARVPEARHADPRSGDDESRHPSERLRRMADIVSYAPKRGG